MTASFSLSHLAAEVPHGARVSLRRNATVCGTAPTAGVGLPEAELARSAAYAAARAYVLDKNPQTHAAYLKASKAWLALLDLSKGAKA